MLDLTHSKGNVLILIGGIVGANSFPIFHNGVLVFIEVLDYSNSVICNIRSHLRIEKFEVLHNSGPPAETFADLDPDDFTVLVLGPFIHASGVY